MFNIFHWQHLLHGPYTDEFTGCCNSTEYKSKIFREASETNHQKYIRRGNLNILSLAHVNINSIRKHFESVAEDKSSNFDLLMWRLGVAVITTAQLHSTKPELRFCAGSNPARRVRDSRWWGSLTIVPAGNKAKRLSSVNHTTETIHHHHHHHYLKQKLIIVSQKVSSK